MAGDWIKMRADLRSHPKVVRISSALKADRLTVVGGLHAVWCLFDAHSIDGRLDGYTLEALDDLIGFTGFGAAMQTVGWLESDADSLSTPRFDEHNGQSAKRRATETQRKRDERNVSASGADKKRSREEKRREEDSVSKDTDAEASIPKKPKLTDPKEIIFSYGVGMLVNAGTDDKAARTFLGGLVKVHGDAAVVNALRSCAEEKAVQPLTWLAAALPPGGTASKPNKQEALEQRGQRVVDEWANNGVIDAAA